MTKSRLYPQSPLQVNPLLTKPSAAYLTHIGKVTGSIILFILLYLLLLLVSVLMLYYGVIAGIFIISLRVHWITVAIGGGIVALTAMFCWFLVKFIFKTYKNENPQRIQIIESQHPELFAFIRQVASEVKAPFPKKIFISPDVNACVFYNSSFLSLFLPVPKNLEIGLALVNSLNMSEFKAVLAHEFGHFSQRSMKLGSYTYTVNHILYNLVYEQDSWDHTLVKWAEIGGVFGMFAWVTAKLVALVRWLLRKAYELINLSYMGLSREMEYHADSIAVSLSGSESMKHALRRVEFCDSAYQNTLQDIQKLAEQNIATDNILLHHQASIRFLAQEFELVCENGYLPLITDSDLKKRKNQSRIYIKNQWASHPTQAERESNIMKIVVEASISQESPWLLFTNPVEMQQLLTQQLYTLMYPNKTDWEKKSFAECQAQILAFQTEEKLFDPSYKGYYEGRYLEVFDVEQAALRPSLSLESELFSESIKDKIDAYLINTQDLDTLNDLKNDQIRVRSFDFDGVKYKTTDAAHLFYQIQEEIETQHQWLQQQDEKVFVYHYQKAYIQNPELATSYKQQMKNYLELQELVKKYMQLHGQLNVLHYKVMMQTHWTEEILEELRQETFSLRSTLANLLQDAEVITLPTAEDEPKSLKEHIFSEELILIHHINTEVYNQFITQAYGAVEKTSDVFRHSLKKLLHTQIQIQQLSEP